NTTHRILHSFPTRRSSDLTIEQINNRVKTMTPLEASSMELFKIVTGDSSAAEMDLLLSAAGEVLREEQQNFDDGEEAKNEEETRSEEHTSELQSRENLVCR